jgi:hypothetical protein
VSGKGDFMPGASLRRQAHFNFKALLDCMATVGFVSAKQSLRQSPQWPSCEAMQSTKARSGRAVPNLAQQFAVPTRM